METKWGLSYHKYFHTGTETFIAPVPEGGGAAAFVPRTRAALLGSPHALVLVFRGSEPTNLINLRSSGRRGPEFTSLSQFGFSLNIEVFNRQFVSSHGHPSCQN